MNKVISKTTQANTPVNVHIEPATITLSITEYEQLKKDAEKWREHKIERNNAILGQLPLLSKG